MYKHGVLARSQIPHDLSMEMSCVPELAFTLLGEIELPLSAADEVAIEMICDAMATGHGLVHRRRTFARRYDRINTAIVEAVARHLPEAIPLHVYDVAVSNGISSVEFFEALDKRFNPEFYGMDYLDSIRVVAVQGGWRVIFDNSGRPLQALGHGFVIPLATRVGWRYPVNRVLRAWLKRRAVPRATTVLAKSQPNADEVVYHDAFHPRARAVANRDPRFRLGFGDMYEAIPNRFDLIRAMSVFSNLDAARVLRATTAMCHSLKEGGLFVVGRNRGRHSDEIPTTIFRRDGGSLLPVVDLMGGAEQRQIISEISLNT